MKKLIIINMQNDFITGTLPVTGASEIVDKMIDFVNHVKENDYEDIILVYDTHHEDYLSTPEGKALPVKHCIEGTEGWKVQFNVYQTALDSEVRTRRIEKYAGDYDEWQYENVRSAEELTVVGLGSDVVSNAKTLKALYPNIKVVVYPELCAGLTEQDLGESDIEFRELPKPEPVEETVSEEEAE